MGKMVRMDMVWRWRPLTRLGRLALILCLLIPTATQAGGPAPAAVAASSAKGSAAPPPIANAAPRVVTPAGRKPRPVVTPAGRKPRTASTGAAHGAAHHAVSRPLSRAATPGTHWYFAAQAPGESVTSGRLAFHQLLYVLNPNAVPAPVTFTYTRWHS